MRRPIYIVVNSRGNLEMQCIVGVVSIDRFCYKMTIHGGLHGSGVVDDDELVSLGVPGTSIDGHVLKNELEGVEIRPS